MDDLFRFRCFKGIWYDFRGEETREELERRCQTLYWFSIYALIANVFWIQKLFGFRSFNSEGLSLFLREVSWGEPIQEC